MTIDEEIKHQEEISDRYERMSEYEENEGNEGIMKDCAQCAADHRQLAEWLTELKELREENSELLSKVSGGDVLRICQLEEQLEEAKRLLKAAVEDMNNGGCNSNCYKCKHCGACDYSERFTWKLTDEALKLIGGSENENNK